MVNVFGREGYCSKIDAEDKSIEPAELFAGVDKERLALYAKHVGIRRFSLTKSCYSLTLKVIGQRKREIVEEYWIAHRSSSFNPVYELEKFPAFIREQKDLLDLYPYLADLAEYEWLRRSALICPAQIENGDKINYCSKDNRKKYSPLLNATLVLKRFDYPVHTIASRVAASRWRKYSYEKNEVYLLAFQDLFERDQLRVMELGELAWELVNLACCKHICYEELLGAAAQLMPEQSYEETSTDIIGLLQDFELRGILTGSRAFSERVKSHG
ncbi:MAG: hypothetical protein K2X81_03955 [Candidatus Obscuribacterales bacterium]|nr:hypothetical protein [Candidatus Obscuribacterales bacterium]